MLLKFLKFLLFVLLALNILAWALYVFWPFDAQDFEEYERKKKAGILFPKSDSEDSQKKAEPASVKTSSEFKMDQVQIKPVREAVSVQANAKSSTSIKQWIATDGKKESDKLFDQIKAKLPAKVESSSSVSKALVKTVVAVPSAVPKSSTLIIQGDLHTAPPSTAVVKASFTVSKEDFKIQASSPGAEAVEKTVIKTSPVQDSKSQSQAKNPVTTHSIGERNTQKTTSASNSVASSAGIIKNSSSKLASVTDAKSDSPVQVATTIVSSKVTAESAGNSPVKVEVWPFQVNSVIQNPFDQKPVTGVRARLGKKSELLVRVPKKLIKHTIGSQLAQDHLEFWVHHPKVAPRDGYGSISYQFGVGLGRKPWVEEFLKTDPKLNLKVEKRVLKNEVEIIITGWNVPGMEWNLVFSKTAEVQGLWQQGIMQSLVPGFEWGQREGLIQERQSGQAQ